MSLYYRNLQLANPRCPLALARSFSLNSGTARVLSCELAEPPRIVLDTNVLVGALLRREGSNRRALRACLEGRLQS